MPDFLKNDLIIINPFKIRTLTHKMSTRCKKNLTLMANYGIIENVIAYENRAVFN